MGAVVIDANVVIAAAEPGDALHGSAVETLRSARLAGDEFILPASVLAEALVRAYRIGDDVGTANERDLVGLFGPVRIIDQDVVSATARLRGRHRALRMADAFVIATGIVDRAITLTYDRRLGSIDPSVRVLVP